MSESVAAQRWGVDQQALARAGLVVGAIALAIGTLSARSDPATGYEVSIYTATPLLFWVGVAVALGLSLGVALFTPSPTFRQVGLLLGGLAMLAVVGLPLVRGYAFYGTADPMSHLGWLRDLAAGDLWLPALLYPGLHGTAMLVQSLVGGPFTRTMMLVPLVYVLLFIVAVPLAAHTIAEDWVVVVVSAFAAFMLLPVNNISAHLTAHPSTLAIFFTPFVLAVLIGHIREVPPNASLVPTSSGLVLALATTAVVFIHPQQAGNLLLVIGTIAIMQTLRRRRSDRPHRRLYGQTVLLGTLLAAWGLSHARVVAAVEGFVLALFTQGETRAIAQRSESLFAIGASPQELFVKLFLVSAVLAGFAGLVVLASWTGRLEDRFGPDVVAALGAGLVPVGVLFLLYLGGGTSTIFFRHIGFIMSLVTLLGAIGIVYVWRANPLATKTRRDRQRRGSAGFPRAVVAVGLAVMLLLSVAAIYPSPYIYKPTSHVTEASLEGHQAAFDYAAPGVELYGIRTGPDRYRDALTGTGTLDSGWFRDSRGVTGDELEAGLAEAYDRQLYLVVNAYDVGRERDAFRNLRYSNQALETIGDDPGVHRVMTNGDVDLYLAS